MSGFVEKPPGDEGFINGGFFVLDPAVIDRIEGDFTSWEAGPLEALARHGELQAYMHRGFWHAMDTLRDKNLLEELLAIGPSAMEGLGVSGLVDASFWQGRRVLLTGHTGFKGAWCSLWLARMGAEVTGLGARARDRAESLQYGGGSLRCPVLHRRSARLRRCPAGALPRRLPKSCCISPPSRWSAARCANRSRPLPRMFSARRILLDCLRDGTPPRVVLVVTTDKVYENAELRWRLSPRMTGSAARDPYSASKAAAEIVTRSMAKTYFDAAGVPVATARGGNVIGGGDYAEDRLVPDIVRAVANGTAAGASLPGCDPAMAARARLPGRLSRLTSQALAGGRDLPRALNVGPGAGHRRHGPGGR